MNPPLNQKSDFPACSLYYTTTPVEKKRFSRIFSGFFQLGTRKGLKKQLSRDPDPGMARCGLLWGGREAPYNPDFGPRMA
jgi:hypothetical protein